MATACTTFASRLAAWVGPDGQPCCWRHYVIGMSGLAAQDLLQRMSMREAVVMAQANQEELRKWSRSIRNQLGN